MKGLIFVLLSYLFPAGKPIQPDGYDGMTKQEHDKCGAWWNYCPGDESAK